MTDISSTVHVEPELEAAWLRRLSNRLGIDRAVVYSVAQRVWQLLAGPITILLIGKFFTLEVQGFYYLFWGLLVMQMIFELSLPPTLIVTASHLWGNLRLNERREIVGDPDNHARLYDLTRISMKVFMACACVFAVVAGSIGIWLCSSKPESQTVTWFWPWIALVATSTIAFAMTPLFSILEGCNRVAGIFQLQFIRGVLGNIVIWICIPLGFGLWVPAIVTVVRLVCDGWMVAVRYGGFFRSMSGSSSSARIDWRREVWPFQSRLLLKGLFYFLNFDLMIPVIFYYFGSAYTGPLGMTIQVLIAVRAVCSSWVRARFARMGVLVSQARFDELDRLFGRLAVLGTLAMVGLSVGYMVGLFLLQRFAPGFATSLLPAIPTVFLLVGLLAALIVEFLWLYIHSYRVSPQLILTLVGNLISGVLIWWWGAQWNQIGVTAAYCVVQVLFCLPVAIIVWRNLKRSRNGLDNVVSIDS